MKSLYYEIDQIKNYRQQARVLDRHHNASMKKWIKKDSFLIAEKKVLWAIGGDIDNPKCEREEKLKWAVQVHANLTNCTHVSSDFDWVFSLFFRSQILMTF